MAQAIAVIVSLSQIICSHWISHLDVSIIILLFSQTKSMDGVISTSLTLHLPVNKFIEFSVINNVLFAWMAAQHPESYLQTSNSPH